MFSWILLAQLAVVDSNYSSAALRSFVAEASKRNRSIPEALGAYRARVESEIAVATKRLEGTENVVSIEQISNEVRWRVPGTFTQHVVGYRTQSLGFQLSSLSFIQSPWTVPILYGNRLAILFGRDTSRAAVRRRAQQRITAIHPLAEDRDRAYQYRGGDTVITMRVGDRVLPIIRVHVEPRAQVDERLALFVGELDIDATRFHLVRMRGTFVVPNPAKPSLIGRAFSLTGFQAVAFVELENAEFEGKYWLPAYQRFEAQAAWTATSESRFVYRIISRFRQHQINDTLVSVADSLEIRPYTLTRAPNDSLGAFRQWRADLGTLSADAHAEDFDDLGPDAWRPVGTPRTTLRVQRFRDAFHVNRVEGVYSGWGLERRFRDQAPGLTLRGNAGYAWAEERWRGQVAAEQVRGPSTYTLRAARALDLTNDFRSALDSGSSLATLFGVDDYDYVDREFIGLGISQRFGKKLHVIRLETGPVRDRAVARHWSQGVIRSDSGLRENRGVLPGRYWRTWGALEWNPQVSAEFMSTGVGGLLTVEHASGELNYKRIDARLLARTNRNALTIVGRLDGGVLLGDNPPPQQLYELGSTQYLQGYGYKEFTGNRAVVARALGMYRLPILQAPLPVGRLLLPALAPALAVGVQSAWSDLVGAGAVRSSGLLASHLVDPAQAGTIASALLRAVPTTGPTGSVRSSVTLGFRFFGGAFGIGMARAVDQRDSWRLRLSFGQII